MIPKIIHYVWVGPKAFPEDGQRNVESWRAVCPDYEFKLWTEDNIDFSAKFVREAYASRAWNRVGNYVRVAALLKYGGTYMDHDIELRQPLDRILEANEAFVGFQTLNAGSIDIVNNAVLGAVPDHPFFVRVKRTMDSMDGRAEVGSGSGPGLLSRLFRESGLSAPIDEPTLCAGVTIYPPRFFYPYEWTEKFSESCVTLDTIAIHHWAHLWKPSPSISARAQRKFRRIAARLFPNTVYEMTIRRNRKSKALDSASRPK